MLIKLNIENDKKKNIVKLKSHFPLFIKNYQNPYKSFFKITLPRL